MNSLLTTIVALIAGIAIVDYTNVLNDVIPVAEKAQSHYDQIADFVEANSKELPSFAADMPDYRTRAAAYRQQLDKLKNNH